jgi:hypothetical protein
MAQNTLIARAGRGLLDVLTLLMRGVGALCAAIGSFVLFAWQNSEENVSQPDELTDAERQMRDLDPNFKNGGYYNYDRY